MLEVGIVGLPNSGKSTLFNALMQRQIANVADYPFTTIEPNVGIVEVPDERLEKISQVTGINKIVPAAIKFVDIAGLVKGAHKGEGLGNQFLAHIRECDVILFVLRYFENPNIAHPFGKVDPKEDYEVLCDELILKDLETVDKSLEEAKAHAKADLKAQDKVHLLAKVKKGLEEGKLIKGFVDDEELAEISNLFLLTAKSQLLVLNVSESQLFNKFEDLKLALPAKPILISAKLESEILVLSEEEKMEYLATSGISQTGLDKIIKESYKLLDLITFFTIAKGTQVQAWPAREGVSVFEAAGIVHSDFQKGFITSGVLKYRNLLHSGSWQKAHELGKIQTCGKDYKVADGDIIEFKAKV
jgi:GTP-binding protein YchF